MGAQKHGLIELKSARDTMCVSGQWPGCTVHDACLDLFPLFYYIHAHTVTKDTNVCCCCPQKERDLELAARIGQTLLERNKELSNKNDELEQEVAELQEKVC